MKLNDLGHEIFEDFEIKKNCSIKKIINWLYFTENLLEICGKLMTYYQEISIAELYDNNFKVKLKNPSDESKIHSIGFLFGLFEDYVN